MSQVIAALEQLPTEGLTVSALRALDFAVPGAWENTVRFDTLVAQVAGVDKPALAAAVRQRAAAIEAADPRWGRALKVYQLVDSVDQVAAAAAAANKVGQLFGGLGFLEKVTPKPETTQALDAGAKLVAELLAFGLLNGMPTTADSLPRFVVALSDYGRYDLVRIAAWVVFDGMLPLGPDFVRRISGTFRELADSALTEHRALQPLSAQLPGATVAEKKAFVVRTIDTTGEWVQGFVKEKGLTPEVVMAQVESKLSIAKGSMDVVAAAIDASTTLTAHTGTQTVARALARRAVDELKAEAWTGWVERL